MSADVTVQIPLDAVPDAVLVVNQVGEIIAANTLAEKLFGYSRDLLIGKPVEWLIPSTVRERHLNEREDYFRDPRMRPMGAALNLLALRSDGTEIPVDINLSPLTTESGTFVVAAIRDATELRRVDVTERKRAEQAVRESDELLRLAAQCGRMFAYEWDAATDVLTRSGESAEILGIDKATPITGQQVLAGVHPDDRDRLLTAMAALSPARFRLQISYRIIRPDGTVIWIERNSRAYFDEHGRLLRIIGMVADVSARKHAEEALSQVDAKLIEVLEEERTRIARELHDDISQRVALLTVQLDHMKQGLPAAAADLKRTIGEARKQTVELGNDIQALSHRLHSSKLLRHGVVAAAQSLCRELSEQHKVDIDFAHLDVPPSVSEDISLCLFRVLQEALHNAVKHSGVAQFNVHLRGSADAISLTVRDAGLGFHPEQVVDNRGLGLVSMRERVDLAKGTLAIDSRPGRGTTIDVRVPLNSSSDTLRAIG